jgi:peptidoglycan-N-acetylglucosamine deacetylase
MTHQRRKLAMTVDFEDYRRQELRDHLGEPRPANPAEVEQQLDMLLELFDRLGAQATFFSVGRLTGELNPSVWRRIVARHRLGCHGHEHQRVFALGRDGFRDDLHQAKLTLEDASGTAVDSFRAPYFASDGTDPWFGEVLAAEGFRIDSSRRLGAPPPDFAGTYQLDGAGGQVLEVPLPSIGYGPKRLSVIGGTYFRLLPLRLIRGLLERTEQQGFLPIIYLHPYDIDPDAPPLAYPRWGYWRHKAGGWMRRIGRGSAAAKLRALTDTYEFESLEQLLALDS